MTNSVFQFMLSTFGRLLALVTDVNLPVVDIDLGLVHYQMTILECAVSFICFDLSMVILSIPIQGAIGHELRGLEDAFIDD